MWHDIGCLLHVTCRARSSSTSREEHGVTRLVTLANSHRRSQTRISHHTLRRRERKASSSLQVYQISIFLLRVVGFGRRFRTRLDAGSLGQRDAKQGMRIRTTLLWPRETISDHFTVTTSSSPQCRSDLFYWGTDEMFTTQLIRPARK
jgi:hypothetical protein